MRFPFLSEKVGEIISIVRLDFGGRDYYDIECLNEEEAKGIYKNAVERLKDKSFVLELGNDTYFLRGVLMITKGKKEKQGEFDEGK